MSKNLYLVPFDFSPVSEKALEYALFLGSKVHTEIRLLHLSPDKPKGMAMKAKLEEKAKSVQTPIGTTVTALVKVGNIFTDIGKIAKNEKAQLIVMGTHGMRGFQKLMGSHAMKVIKSADCPFLIVQDNTIAADVKNIAVAVDLSKESLQIVNIAGDMANILKSQVHVLAEKQKDQILNTRLQNRLSIVSKQYEERDMDAKISLLKKGGKYDKNVMKFVKSQNMDMIALAYHSESFIPQFDRFAQRLITNKLGKPVLIVNSKLASALYF